MDITVGVDEAGRGCWAGPLVAAAVILKQPINGLKDSKLLTRLQREALAREIKAKSEAWGLGWVEPAQIDAIGLTKATTIAMNLAVQQLPLGYQEIIIDGNFNYLADKPMSRTLVKADVTVPGVSAASILAKVARDDYMLAAAKKFPLYHFDKHVGYGTHLHLESIKRYGACELHRLSYKPLQAFKANRV